VDYRCKSPVAFLIFNRPATTQAVFAEIARAKPPKLLVVADGPRPDRPGEDERCQAARKILDGVNWDCHLQTNFAEDNLGCRDRVATGINWVFDNVEEAIILEDDCLPHPSFFTFCDDLLERYRHDERIMAISGDNFQFGHKRWEYSYYYSRYVHIWGWASWRRAWNHYDVNLSSWPAIRESGWLRDILGARREAEYWEEVFDLVHAGHIGTWDYQWVFACWMQSALCVLPNVNLVSNIGFGTDATHTGGSTKVARLPAEEMPFPLEHPPVMIRDSVADRRTAELFFRRTLLSKTRIALGKWRND
jgi:hypothetical protein